MSRGEELLTFELSAEGDQLEVHCNEEGLRTLIDICSRLLRTGGHDHLMTPSWGGSELSEDRQGEDNRLLHMVTIRLWREESAQYGPSLKSGR